MAMLRGGDAAGGGGALAYAPAGTHAPGSAGYQQLMAAPFFEGKQGVGPVTVDPTGGFQYSTFGPANALARQVSGALSRMPLIGGQVAAGQRAADQGDWLRMVGHGLGAGGIAGLTAAGLAGAAGVPMGLPWTSAMGAGRGGTAAKELLTKYLSHAQGQTGQGAKLLQRYLAKVPQMTKGGKNLAKVLRTVKGGRNLPPEIAAIMGDPTKLQALEMLRSLGGGL